MMVVVGLLSSYPSSLYYRMIARLVIFKDGVRRHRNRFSVFPFSFDYPSNNFRRSMQVSQKLLICVFLFRGLALISAFCSFLSRFLINIPEEERKDIVRLCFQIEAAHWFYVDFHRQEQPNLPPCGLKDFTKINILFLIITISCTSNGNRRYH